MENPFQYLVGSRPHFRPVFKFLSQTNFDRLFKVGSVRIPRIEEFRKYTYGGLTFDPREGQATIQGGDKTAEVDVGHYHGYCVTRHFWSESFEWALDEPKEACALILNWEEFVRKVDLHLATLGFKIIGQGPCAYFGNRDRIITEPEVSRALSEDPRRVALLKPAEYSRQLEVRALWEHDDAGAEDDFEIPELIPLCLPVWFPELTLHRTTYLANPNLPIGCRFLIRGSSGPYPEFEIGFPRDIRSFIAYVDEDGRNRIGILEHRNVMRNATFSNASVGVTFGGGPPIVLTQLLEDVAGIEFFIPESVKSVIGRALQSA
jgi:hypothetical protein